MDAEVKVIVEWEKNVFRLELVLINAITSLVLQLKLVSKVFARILIVTTNVLEVLIVNLLNVFQISLYSQPLHLIKQKSALFLAQIIQLALEDTTIFSLTHNFVV